MAGAAATLPFRNLAMAAPLSPARDGRRPNILILQPDQHSSEVLGCGGNPHVITPHLDALARESVHFRRAVANSPVCCPWRASMQTGLYFHTHGIDTNSIQLNPDFVCIAEVLNQAGYETGYIGKWHLDGGIPKVQPGGWIPPGPRRQGWKEWYGYQKNHEYFDVWRFNDNQEKVRVPNYSWEPTWHTDMTLDFIKRRTAEGKPWCFYTAYGPPHEPEECKKEFLDLYDRASFQLTPAQKANFKNEARLRQSLQMYYGQVTAIDHEVGRLLKGLDEMGLAENTIVMYVSDHGDVLGRDGRLRGKGVPYASAFRVPTLIRWKGTLAPRQSDALIAAPDLPTTLLDLAGLPVPGSWQGTSFAPACRGEAFRERTAVYMGLRGWRAVWDGRYLYSEGKPNCLYDHGLDPYELENRLDDTRLVREMKEKLRLAAIESHDPAVS